MTNLGALPADTELAGDFKIERVLGAGGFGITYLANEVALGRAVTIKEYFPADFAHRHEGGDASPRSMDCAGDYKWGLERFIEEAQTLARFNHPNIVRVYRYFEARNTAYMVLHFEEGASFKNWLKNLGRAPRQKEIDGIVGPLLDALEVIHKADFLHRDIAPDNIIVRNDGSPVLIDFGSARGEIASHSKTVSALVKPGYSPYEQYAETSRNQGPWTDIYALAATLYHAITGKRPPDAPSRMVQDDFVPSREAALSSYRPSFLSALDRALALNVDARPQSVPAWRGDLLAPEPAKPGWMTRKLQKKPASGPDFASGARTVPLGTIPPPPDAPGPKGGLLDFLERLKGPPESDPQADLIELPDKPVSTIAVSEKRPVPRVLLPSRRKPLNPRPVRSGPSRLRPLLFKLLIGAGIAGGAVAIQDKLPRYEKRGSATTASLQDPSPLVTALKGHAGPVTSVVYTADGRSIVTAGADATLRIWNASGGLLRTIELDHGAPSSLAIFGNRALTAHSEGQIDLWDVDTAERVSTYRRNEANIWSVAFAGERDRFAASGHDWKVALWDARLKEGPVHVFDGHESAAKALAFSPGGPFLASGSADRTVKLWNLDTLDLVRTYRGARDFVTALAFSPNGRVLAAADLDGQIRLWFTTSSRMYRVMRGHKGRVGSLAFSPSGDILASSGDDGTVRLWDVRRGRTAKTLAGHGGAVRAVVFSPDGDRVASASDDGTVRLWTPDILRRPPARETN